MDVFKVRIFQCFGVHYNKETHICTTEDGQFKKYSFIKSETENSRISTGDNTLKNSKYHARNLRATITT